jgi:hypothetical protein
MKLFNIDGKKTAVLNMFIDPENGFLRLGLSDEDGGVLYVPGGEEVAPIMGEIIGKSRGSIFIIGQDYHPRNHISFMVNHPGVMDYRTEQFRKFLQAHHQPLPATAEDLYKQAQQPVHFFDGYDQPPAEFPFPELVLDENRNIIGLKEGDGRIRDVRVDTNSGKAPDKDDRGRVGKVLDSYHRKTFDQYRAEGRLLSTQSLWTMHCVQGTKSSLYPDELSLPQGLKTKLAEDLKSDYIHYHDATTDNDFFVIRKGSDPELDSYGIGVENDCETMTVAWEVFGKIATDLKRLGCERVVINGGGLASNICSEFSLNNTQDFLAGLFRMRGMQVSVNYVPEISRGIPIPGDESTPFSLAGTEFRLASRGVGKSTVKDILALGAGAPTALPRYIAGPAQNPT